MADNKPSHRLLLAYPREIKSGNTITTKTAYHEVCGLWMNDKGSISGEIPRGLTLSGRVLIVPADRADSAEQAPPAADTGDLSDY